MTPFTYSPKAYDIFIGLDVDKNSFSFTVRDHGTMKRSKRIPSDPEHLLRYIQKSFPHQRVLCAYEAGPTGFHLYDNLTARNLDCFVLSPSSIPKPPNARVKNNRLDSERIVEHIRSKDTHPIRVPQGPYRELRHLVTLRENYVSAQKTAKQRIKALVLYAHLASELTSDADTRWSKAYIEHLKKIPCSACVRQRLDMLLSDLDYARRQTLAIHRALKAFCQKHKEIIRNIGYLRSIPGIGFITAVTLLGRIGDPQQLRNVRELGAFIGLVPREKSTGDEINYGSITHLGNHTLRSLLIEAAWVAIRYDTELNQFYHRIKARHHPKIAALKAIVAVARKLTHRIYRVLKEQRMYLTH